MKKLLAVLAVGGMLMAIPSQSEAQVGVRLGLSHMTGLAGIEYQTGNISVGAGPSVEGQVAISARYSLNAEGNTLWAGLAYVIARAEVWEKDADGWNTIEDAASVGPLVGYKMDLGETLDLSIGAGYGPYLGADADLNDETGGLLLDVSLGYSF
ncbi:MAG: hypothetical protein VX294_02455 [Candidatus Latescibacterota bacterium]|nr:hypothetical protein [Candidatus Latescibacterota bacterium]